VAVTKLSLLEFNAVDFNWFLRRTAAFARLQNLSESRLNFSYDIIESNQVFRKLTNSQRTMLEIILSQRDVKAGQVIWEAGDKCSAAVIIDKGQFGLKDSKIPLSQVPAAATSGSSTPPQTVSRKHRPSYNVRAPSDAHSSV
jgi:hypothetical protein